MKSSPLSFGIDEILIQSASFKNQRLALVTNDAATTSDGELSRVALLRNGFRISRIFSPEHGLSAMGADGAFQPNQTDSVTGLPVTSLYGDQLKPSKEDLADVDQVLFDIPDAGCRFYTYLWTMTYIMESCNENSKPLIILDRPNPLGGNLDACEGPMLDELHCSSFIGRWSIPVRHGCTYGELADYFSETKLKSNAPVVIKTKNWRRQESLQQAGWFFKPPSPSLPGWNNMILYPGVCLLEGINVDEGRGTDHPFIVCGAPWIKAEELASAFTNINIPGIECERHHYIPAEGIYKNENCAGLRFKITDSGVFRPVETGLQLIRLFISLYPAQVKIRNYFSRANPGGESHLDRLTGVYDSWKKLVNGNMNAFDTEVPGWQKTIKPWLLY